MRAVRGLEDVPERLLRRLDREGSSRISEAGLWAGAPELRPRFVLRVRWQVLKDREIGATFFPGASESSVAETAPPHPALSGAAMLFDARSTVPLRSPDGTVPPVIDDDACARYVLDRAVRNGSIYLPSLRAGGRLPRPVPARLDRAEDADEPGSGELGADLDAVGRPTWFPAEPEDAWIVGAIPALVA